MTVDSMTADGENTLTVVSVVTLVASVDIKHQVCEDPGVEDREM